MIAFSQLEGRTLINAVLRNKPTSLLRPPLIVHSSSSPMQFIQIKTRNVFIVCMYVNVPPFLYNIHVSKNFL